MLKNLLEKKEYLGLLPLPRALPADMTYKKCPWEDSIPPTWECMEQRSTLMQNLVHHPRHALFSDLRKHHHWRL